MSESMVTLTWKQPGGVEAKVGPWEPEWSTAQLGPPELHSRGHCGAGGGTWAEQHDREDRPHHLVRRLVEGRPMGVTCHTSHTHVSGNE